MIFKSILKTWVSLIKLYESNPLPYFSDTGDPIFMCNPLYHNCAKCANFLILSVIQTRLLQATDDTVTTIDSRNYNVSSELMSIQVPAELIQLYANTIDNARVGGVKAISAIYQNVDNFSFPDSRPEMDE